MIYGVFGGEYSDWYSVGYFDNEEEAEAYCESYNAKKSGWECDLYVIRMPNLKDGKKEGVLIEFYMNPDGSIHQGNFETFNEDSPAHRWEMDEICGRPLFRIWIDPTQRDKVEKIMHDRYAEYLAEREGLV